MTIVKRSRVENFAIVPNSVTEDTRLSFEARGVLCYLLAKPDTWQIRVSDIQKQGGFGRDKAYRILKELRDVGYLVLEVNRNDKARITSQTYIVYDVAGVSEKLRSENPTTDNVQKPRPENPDTVSPDKENTHGIINKDNKQIPSLMSETGSDATTTKPKARNTYPELFDQCWKEYPTDANMSKKEAFAEWKKLSDEDRLAVKASIPAFKAFCERDKTYRPIHMCRYISKERWKGHLAHSSPQNPKNAFTGEQWEKYLKYARSTHEWRADLWGACPGEPNCRVPPHLIQSTDGKNWRSIGLHIGKESI